MQRLKINPAFQQLLNDKGLNSVQAFMAFNGGEVLEENKKRDTRRIKLGDKTFYLKRTKLEKKSASLERLLLGALPHSKPFNEAIHIEELNKANINTMTVAATGEKLSLGLPTCGFILSYEVKGQEMEAAFQSADDTDRASIASAFGQLLAELHRKGFYAATRLKDIFCKGDISNYKNYQLIDRETRNPFPKRFSQTRAIASLNNGFRRQGREGSNFNELEQQALLSSYCQALSEQKNFDPAEFLKSVQA